MNQACKSCAAAPSPSLDMLSVIFSEDFLEHQTGAFHPECPARLVAIASAIQQAPWSEQIAWHLPTPVAQRAILPVIEQVHHPEYVTALRQLAEQGGGNLDPDTPVSTRSYDVALLAVSAWLDGIDQIWETPQPTFVLARPPGHHALQERGMGFCLLANAAIAAHYALQRPDVNRVAILDWDVHHGNGTEAIVASHPQICYCSLHQYPFYPGTGAADDRGQYGNVLNIPLEAGSTLREYQIAFEAQVMPFIHGFRPDLLIVSAGYDANRDDPLAGIALLPQDYGTLTQYCLEVTPRILFGLEGGYHLDALAQSVVATIAACLPNTAGPPDS